MPRKSQFTDEQIIRALKEVDAGAKATAKFLRFRAQARAAREATVRIRARAPSMQQWNSPAARVPSSA